MLNLVRVGGGVRWMGRKAPSSRREMGVDKEKGEYGSIDGSSGGASEMEIWGTRATAQAIGKEWIDRIECNDCLRPKATSTRRVVRTAKRRREEKETTSRNTQET